MKRTTIHKEKRDKVMNDTETNFRSREKENRVRDREEKQKRYGLEQVGLLAYVSKSIRFYHM